MTAAVVPLLRIPPFPNSARGRLAHRAHGGRVSDGDVDRVAAALAEAKVGGTYWGLQPPLPGSPYTLVRLADPAMRLDAITGVCRNRPIVVWVESARKMKPGGPSQVHLVSGIVDPWHLLGGAEEVIVDSHDELALLAGSAQVPLTCVGSGRFASLGAGGASAVRGALRLCTVDGFQYSDPFTGADIGVEDAISLCRFWRQLIDANRKIAAAVGFAFWKRPTVAPMLWGGSGPVPFVDRPKSTSEGEQIAVWKTRADPATMARLGAGNAQLVEVEDGFIRSTGLGADCVPPLSIIVDQLGIYFDPNHPSELERLLQEGEFGEDMLDRARRLRKLIVELGISKYGAGVSTLVRPALRRLHILVPGQVEDDRSVQCGGGAVSTNLDLLRRVRQRNPDAYISYKPHPDVEAGHRRGAIPDDFCLTLADETVRTPSISSLIEVADEVHVNTSLAGFEALLRGKPVTTYGVPFYAGWGLTRDLGNVPDRRTTRRTLDELVAASLLLYPRYLDPASGLPCPSEILVRRLAEGTDHQRVSPVVRLRRWQGRVKRAASRIWAR